MSTIELSNTELKKSVEKKPTDLAYRFKGPDCVRKDVHFKTPMAFKKYQLSLAEKFHKDLSKSGKNQAKIRLLPYPFNGYLTICSDCDSPKLEAFIGVGKKVREHYTFPIADSFFPNWLFKQGLDSNQNFDQNKFETTMFEWLRLFHNGGFDSIHGWFTRLRIMIADSFFLSSPMFAINKRKYKEIFNQHNLSFEKTRFNKSRSRLITFSTPPGWHAKDPPKYLIFNLYMPLAKTKLCIQFMEKNKVLGVKEIWIADTCISRQAPTEMIIDMTELFDIRSVDLNKFKIKFTQRRSGITYIGNPSLYSNTRAEISAQKQLLERYNLFVDVYTSHGGGYDIGRQTVSDFPSADPRVLAEHTSNPSYGMDLFEAYGLKYFNTANNTSTEKLHSIDTLVQPYVLNGNHLVFDFNRFMCQSTIVDLNTNQTLNWTIRGETSNPSYADFIGRQVAYSMSGISQLGDGAIIYTHNFSRHPTNENRRRFNHEDIYNEETNSALCELQDRFYNLSGNRLDKERLYVASTSSILKLSRLLQYGANHILYDEDSNEILIEKYKDPLSGQTIPDSISQGSDLAGLTIYVNHSATVKAKSPDGIIQGLIRNPADNTGQESITFADISSPTIIIGQTALPMRKHFNYKLDGLSCQEGSNKLSLENNQAKLTIEPQNIFWNHHSSLLLNAHADKKMTSFRLNLWSEEGCLFSVADRNYPDSTNAWVIPENQLQSNQMIVVPFHFLTSAKNGGDTVPPRGRLTKLELIIHGEEGARIDIKQLSFIRDTIGSIQNELLIGGKIHGSTDIDKIILETYQFGKITTHVKSNNSYIFPFKVTRGSVVKIYALGKNNTVIYPKDGPVQEIWINKLDIDFDL